MAFLHCNMFYSQIKFFTQFPLSNLGKQSRILIPFVCSFKIGLQKFNVPKITK